MTGALQTILSRPKTVITLMIVMVIAGVMSYIGVPKEANPDIDVPVYYVSIGQRGVSPEDAERLLVKPMETQLRGLDGLKEITAIASEGHAGIVLEFQIGSDKDKVLADIRDKVDLAKAELPADADEPAVFETNFALQPTIIVTLSGDVPERTLYNLSRQLKDEIESISTVREANLKGTRQEQLEVILDLLKLESYDITQDELLNALAQYNQLVPAGFIDDGSARFNVKLPGLVENALDVYSIPIKQSGEGVVTLGEVADIRRNFKDASTYTRVNGQPAMSLEVVKRIGTNIIENNSEVRRVVGEFTKDWPDTVKVNFMIDQSSFIFEVLGSLQSSILTAISLVMIVVIASLGLRSGLLVGLAIPTSFMIGFLIVAFLGMTVNMMVMFGLVLTVGMLVDGAIVMIEYADRKMAEGTPPKEAYNRAAKLMFWPIVSSTATTLAAFLPLLLWPGVPGQFMSYLPIMVIIVLTASLLTALVFVPVTGTVMAQTGGAIRGLFGRRKAARINETAQMLSAQAELDPRKLKGFMGFYVRFLDDVSRSLFGNFVVMGTVVAITVATFITFSANSKGVEFFVEEEPDIATVFVQARGNLSGEDIRQIAIEVEQQVLQVAGIENAVLTATAPGGGGGGGGIDVSAPQDMPADVIATMQIELEDFAVRRKASEIFDEIRERTAGIGGTKVEIRKLEGGPPSGKDVRLQVTSNSYDQLTEQVGVVRAYFDSLDTLRDVEDGRPLPGIEWQIDIDREEAGRYNAGIAAVGAMVQLVTNGVQIGKYRPDDSEDEVDILVRLPESERSLDKLSELRLRTPNGQVPISNFIEITPQQKVSSITRRDGVYAMDLKANLADGAMFGDRPMTPTDKVGQLEEWITSQEWPEGVGFRFRGADEEQAESGAFLGKAAAGALFLMFIILVTQFNSFYQTFLTLSTVILAVVGVLIGLIVTGQKFSIIMTGTGVVALAGIVVNNAIVLIDTYNRLRADGVDVHQAVLKTSAQRLRPIMLTTVTTILGLVPMALTINFDYINRVISYGSITSIWWIQLSTAVISGLAFSTLLTLVLTPVMLSFPQNVRELFVRMRGAENEQSTGQEAVSVTSQTVEASGFPAPANDTLKEDPSAPAPARKKSRKNAEESRAMPDAAE